MTSDPVQELCSDTTRGVLLQLSQKINSGPAQGASFDLTQGTNSDIAPGDKLLPDTRRQLRPGSRKQTPI